MHKIIDGPALEARVADIIAQLDGGPSAGQVQELLRDAIASSHFEVPDRIEVHEHRTYEPAVCWMCDKQAAYRVTYELDDELFACHAHKWTAFS